LAVAISYYLGTKVGFALTPTEKPISTFWPPNAILLAALLLIPKRMWWLLILAVLPAHLLVQMQTGVPVLTAIGWFIGNGAEAVLGATLISHFIKTESLFESVHGLVVFLGFGVVLAPLATSFLDAGVVVKTGWGHGYWVLLMTRLFSNMLATMTLVPTIVIFRLTGIHSLRKATLSRWVEAGVLTASIVLVSFFVFGGPYEAQNSVPALIYAPLPLLLWAAVRFGSGGLSASLLVVAYISIWNAMHGRGPFVSPSMGENVLSLQVLLCTIAVPLMLLSALMVERRLANQSLQETSAKLIKAQEEERFRIARELHDDAGQQLSLVEMELGQLRHESDALLKPRLKRVHDQVAEVSRAVHEISHDLYPSALDNLGLAAALPKLCTDVGERIPLKVHLTLANLPEPLPQSISLCLYRVAQEALHNVAKHSYARNATVEIEAVNRHLWLRIVDDGAGFRPGQESKAGLGLASMRERLSSVGGLIAITSAPMSGTRIEASIPLP
jgi:two-component system sensor histidine kinase UhpB